MTGTGFFRYPFMLGLEFAVCSHIVWFHSRLSGCTQAAGLEGLDDMKVDNLKPPVDRFVYPRVQRVIVSVSGRLMILDSAPCYPSFEMSCSFTFQVLAHFDSFTYWKDQGMQD